MSLRSCEHFLEYITYLRPTLAKKKFLDKSKLKKNNTFVLIELKKQYENLERFKIFAKSL